jgi:hypothetical protein
MGCDRTASAGGRIKVNIAIGTMRQAYRAQWKAQYQNADDDKQGGISFGVAHLLGHFRGRRYQTGLTSVRNILHCGIKIKLFYTEMPIFFKISSGGPPSVALPIPRLYDKDVDEKCSQGQ